MSICWLKWFYFLCDWHFSHWSYTHVCMCEFMVVNKVLRFEFFSIFFFANQSGVTCNRNIDVHFSSHVFFFLSSYQLPFTFNCFKWFSIKMILLPVTVGTSLSLRFDDIHCNDNDYNNSVCHIWILKSSHIMLQIKRTTSTIPPWQCTTDQR